MGLRTKKNNPSNFLIVLLLKIVLLIIVIITESSTNQQFKHELPMENTNNVLDTLIKINRIIGWSQIIKDLIMVTTRY